MKENKFVNDHLNSWKQLEELTQTFKTKNYNSFTKAEVENLLNLYNKACSHLSYSRTYFGNTGTTAYLNKLVSTTQEYLYSTRVTSLKKIADFYLVEFPQLVRKYRYAIILSLLLFLAGTLISFGYTLQNPYNALAFLPAEFASNIEDFGKNPASATWDSPVMSSFILTNNIQVGFLAFATGIFLGAGTVYILIYNGFPLGSLAALAVHNNFSLTFWSLILPHGVLELFAIFVCGAAGLQLGYALINPGRFKRMDALTVHGKTAVKLLLGTIPIFIAAGIIEGFYTGSAFTPTTKLLFSLFTLVILLLYINLPLRIKKQPSSR